VCPHVVIEADSDRKLLGRPGPKADSDRKRLGRLPSDG
jgi:hypothetical protein